MTSFRGDGFESFPSKGEHRRGEEYYFSKQLTILGEEKHEKDKDMDVCVKVLE